MSKYKIKAIKDDRANGQSIIAVFQNGELIENIAEKLYGERYKDENNVEKPIIASDTLLYAGETGETETTYNSYIAIINENTKKVELVAADYAVFKPQPPVKRVILDSTQQEVKDNTILELNKHFGSKKAKRMTEQYERLKMNVTSDVKAELEQTVADIDTETVPMEDVTVTSDVMPTPNMKATFADDVYKLTDLIPEHVFNSLDEKADELLESDEFEGTEYLKKEVSRVKQSLIPDKRHKIKIIVYIDLLQQLALTLSTKIAQRTFSICHFSPVVNSYILNNFTASTPKGRTRPHSLRDKSFCHILILSMKVTNNQIDLDNLSKLFKIGLKKITELSRNLLFSSTSKSKSVVHLKIPLPQPIKVLTKQKKR